MKRHLILLFLAAALASCRGGDGSSAPSALLSSVPSDAIEVMHSDKCRTGLKEFLDSASVFRQMDFGHLSDAEMVLSYSYAAKLIPLLVLDAGHADNDSTGVIASVIEQAESRKLKSAFLNSGTSGLKRSMLMLSPSDAVISTALEHISAGTSILAAKDFDKAVAEVSGDDYIILRNSAAARFIPRKFLTSYLQRKELVSFFSHLSDWIVIDMAGKPYGVRFVCSDASDFADHIQSMPKGESRLSSVLPENVEFCVDIPMSSQKKYVEAFDDWLDANSRLDKQASKRESLHSKFGKTTQRWASDYDIREVASVCWDGHRVVLVRPSKAPGQKAVADNRYPGYPAALFGAPFELSDESCSATVGAWIVSGSEKDVTAFVECGERMSSSPWPQNGITFAVCTADWSLFNSGAETKIDVY